VARLSIHLLGSLQITLDGEPVAGFHSDKVRALLVYLAVEAKEPHRREKLSGLLWPERPERSARANLRRALADLRVVIGDHQAQPPFLHISRQTIQFNGASDAWIDVATLTKLLGTKGPSQQMIRHLEEAVALYRGGFLEGFSIGDSSAFEEWALLNRERLHRLVMDALRRLAEQYEERGEYERARPHAWRQVEMDPWREKAHRQLMRLLALSGQRGAALAQYEDCCRLLAEELGVEPAAETTRLYERIRDGRLQARSMYLPDIPTRLSSFLDEETPVWVEQPIFVGRERELGRMDELLETALGGRGQVVFITGDAGRGKTTLLSEFGRRALDAHPDMLLATGSCNAYSGVGDPYLPFRDVIAMLTGDLSAKWAAGVVTREHAVRLWKMLPNVIQLLIERGPELIGIFLPGSELLDRAVEAAPGGADWLERLKELAEWAQARSGSLEQNQLFEQYANVLRGLAAQRPLLLVLDDLQWADDASLSLLFHLGRRIEGSRILIAGAYRPEEVSLGREGERHPLETVLTEFKRYYGDVWIDLVETKETEAKEFLDALLAAGPSRLSEDFRRALFRRTGGHPLFTVELLRAMVERGDLVRDEQGRWVEGAAVDWRTLPARVEGVIEERIGQLEPELREILSVASVEGEEFTAQVVARVQRVGERQLLRTLSQELEKRHSLVRELGEMQVGDRHLSRYQLVHVLFQQYLYHDLSAGERRLLHREVASALEELYGDHKDEIAVQLARHYARDPERERRYARIAGERAAAQFANAEALRYLSRALELTPEGEITERYALLLARESVLDVQGDRKAQKQDLEALEALAGDLGDDHRRAEVALRRAHYAYVTGDYPAAIAAAQSAIRLAEAAQGTSRKAAAYMRWGGTLWRQGDYQAAHRQLEQSLILSRAAGLRRVEADSLRYLGLLSWNRVNHVGARAYFQQALYIYRELGDRRFESGTLNNLGLISIEQGDSAEGRVYYEQALRIFREIGARRGESIVLGNLGVVFAELGDYAQARAYYERSLCIRREIGDRNGECQALSNLGSLFHSLSDYDAAREYSQRALSIAQEIGDRRWMGFALTNLGHAWEGLGRLEEAAKSYRQALEIRRELGELYLALESMAGLARVSLAQGDLERAQNHAEEILAHLDLEGDALIGIEEPFRMYLTCYHVLYATHDSRAEAILNAARRLLQERVARIDDEKLRRSFLENVPAHREIIEVWESK